MYFLKRLYIYYIYNILSFFSDLADTNFLSYNEADDEVQKNTYTRHRKQGCRRMISISLQGVQGKTIRLEERCGSNNWQRKGEDRN